MCEGTPSWHLKCWSIFSCVKTFILWHINIINMYTAFFVSVTLHYYFFSTNQLKKYCNLRCIIYFKFDWLIDNILLFYHLFLDFYTVLVLTFPKTPFRLPFWKTHGLELNEFMPRTPKYDDPFVKYFPKILLRAAYIHNTTHLYWVKETIKPDL